MKRMFLLSTLVILGFVLLMAVPLSSQDCKATCASKSCELKAQKETKTPAPFLCPVCGMKIENLEKSVKLEHNGKTLYFMSEACKTAFVKEPDKYLMACCKNKECFACSKGCDNKAHEAGFCPKCGAAMKKMDATDKTACCQAMTSCKEKQEKK